jgi:dolichyl-diphosphooligosaccharide--protein glycosyltransferase
MTYGKIFIALYGVLSVYFASVMIRLLLVLAPAASVLSGLGLAEIINKMTKHIRLNFMSTINEDNKKKSLTEEKKEDKKATKKLADTKVKSDKDKVAKSGEKLDPKKKVIEEKEKAPRKLFPMDMAAVVLGLLVFLVSSFIFHSTWTAAEAYSSPTIIIASRSKDGKRMIVDDFREAYSWLRHNTREGKLK